MERLHIHEGTTHFSILVKAIVTIYSCNLNNVIIHLETDSAIVWLNIRICWIHHHACRNIPRYWLVSNEQRTECHNNYPFLKGCTIFSDTCLFTRWRTRTSRKEFKQCSWYISIKFKRVFHIKTVQIIYVRWIVTLSTWEAPFFEKTLIRWKAIWSIYTKSQSSTH